jgi:hypothetical protein
VAGAIEGGEGFAGGGEQFAAGGGGDGALRGAVQQAVPAEVRQPADLGADRGLGEVQDVRRFGEGPW